MSEPSSPNCTDSCAEPIFNGLAGESLQAFVDRSVASFARFMAENPDWSPPALNRPRDRYDSEIVGVSRGRGWAS